MKFISIPFYLVCAAGAQAAVSFHPIVDISSTTAADDLWAVSNLIQGPGSGFNAEEPHEKILGGADGNWVTAAPGGFPSDYIAVAGVPILTIDLGSDVDLFEISTWGYAATNTNGVSAFSLRFATAAEGSGGFGTSITYNPTFSMDINDVDRQSSLFSETVTAQWVEMTLDDNHFVAPGDGSGGEIPGGDRVGLGEVAFAVIPEPSAALLGFLGLSLLWRRTRR